MSMEFEFFFGEEEDNAPESGLSDEEDENDNRIVGFLHVASENGNLEQLEALLDRGIHTDWQDRRGRTALSISSFRNDLETVRLLLDRGANMEIKERSNGLSVHRSHTVYNDVVATVRDTRFVGGDHSILPGSSPLYSATARLVLGQTDSIQDQNNKDETPLFIASSHGHVEVVRLLLDRGANIHHQNNDGETPLHIAIRKGHVETVRLLLDKGANINHQCKYGGTPLCTASRGGHSSSPRSGIRHDPNIEDQYLGIVRLLLDRGAHVNHQDNIGRSPLSWAVHFNCLEIAQHLLERGANIESQESNGRTHLFWAIKKNFVDITQLLLDKGANINHQDNDGCTTLIVASCLERRREETPPQLLGQAVINTNDHFFDTIQLLLDRGANTEQQDKDGRTVLSWVALNDHSQMAQLLLERGANINHQDNNGRSPLMLSIIHRHVHMTQFLLYHGSNIGLQDYDGMTSLDCALSNRRHRETFVYLLVQAGAQNDANQLTLIKKLLTYHS
jgi:ankyrin repeat protein